MIWGIYSYSELQKLEFKAEKTFMEMAKELETLKNEIAENTILLKSD